MIPLPTSVLTRRRRSLVAERAGSGVVTIPPYLNDPAATARGMVVNSVGADNLSVTLNASDSRRTYSVPVPPAGSIVSFDLITTVSFYLRLDDENGFASPTTELWQTATPGTYHVEVTIPPLSGQTLLGFLSASASGDIQITNWRVTAPVEPAHPLQPYFDSGTIVIYLDSDDATLDGSGQVTALKNKGAGGAAFDAAVSGTPIPLNGNTLQMSASVGTPILATPASIDGVRLMWACSTADIVSSMRFFGSSSDEIRAGAVQAGPPPSVFIQLWSNRSGTGTVVSLNPRWNIPTSGLHLFELETNLATTTATLYMDGPQVSTNSAVPHAAFQIDRLGQGTGGASQFVGQLGGVLGVLTGRPDTAAAIAAVRSYWTSRFGLVLS